MSVISQGRYPYKSAWAFKFGKTSNHFEFLRTEVRNPTNDGKTMWQNWFLGPDGIGFGTFYRWDTRSNAWIECTDFNVHYF